ncbi:spore coat protein CotF [Sedimentibacter acidaminivorans]|uniref:Spore coat protein CotF n=1 Tax=Sedimentibacter acidaminivorans TaxID=913099 RepID=A0ABS4GG92_9FIRM|nr:spore coat protein [Sedimentibacter acidaminivorans]MBP1926562.1 spore coat protein CotF [Sedimentibacter acidaminivorans]
MNLNLNNNNMASNSSYGEKEVLNEALSTEKSSTGTYNTFVNECANPQLRSDLMQILNNTHKMQADIFNEIQSKGMYQLCQAQQQKISQAKQKYSQQVK